MFISEQSMPTEASSFSPLFLRAMQRSFWEFYKLEMDYFRIYCGL